MPIHRIEQQRQTKQSETFAARKAVLTALTESQKKEHVYHAATAEAVGKHMKALCAVWNKLLINQLRDGSFGVADRFSLASGIRLDQLSAWRSAQRGFAYAEAELAAAKNELAAAEQARTKVAGTLWGAKKGFEQEYAHRDLIVKKAKTNIEHERTRVIEAERSLDVLSEALLRDCIGKSAMVSASEEFGTDIGRILRTMQAEALVLEQQHNEEQSELLLIVADGFSSLAGHYENREGLHTHALT